MTTTKRVTLQWSAGQFSDRPKAHNHDARAILESASAAHVDVCGVSETLATHGNNLLERLEHYAPAYGYKLFSSPRQDVAILVDRTFGHGESRYVPVVAARRAPARQGGHGPRGLFVVSIVPTVRAIAPRITIAGTHFLTRVADPSRRANALIDREAARLFDRAAAGSRLGFLMGDLNTDDQVADGFHIAPLTTCWDELGHWPTTEPTHGTHGPTLDVIASYDHDTRVSLAKAHAFDDGELRLFSDHYTIRATYDVKPTGGH